MAYTPINWAENLEVDATKLDKMDRGIQQNENNISNHESRITTNKNDINSIDIHTGTSYLTRTIDVPISIKDTITVEADYVGRLKNFRIGIEGPADVIRTI